MISSKTRFKCPMCKGLKKRPGRCNLCGELPMGRELLDDEAVQKCKDAARNRGDAK